MYSQPPPNHIRRRRRNCSGGVEMARQDDRSMPERPALVGSSTSPLDQRDQADSFAVGPAVNAPSDRSASLGSGGDGRFRGLAPAALARSAVRRGSRPGLAATLLQRLAHARQLQVAVVLLGDIELLGRAIWVADRQLIG